jgi:hypothetical protein
MKKKSSFFLALAAAAITVFSVWYAQLPIAAREASWGDILAEARAGGYRIITTEALAERYRLDPSALLLVDTRQEWEFCSGHIQGAVNFPMAPTGWPRWRKAGELKTFLGPDTTRVLVFY